MKRQHGRNSIQLVLVVSFTTVLVVTLHSTQLRTAMEATPVVEFAVHDGRELVQCNPWLSRQLGQCLSECSTRETCHGVSWRSTLEQFEATVTENALPIRTIDEQDTEEGSCCFATSPRPRLVLSNPLAQSYLPKSFVKLRDSRHNSNASPLNVHFAVLTSTTYLHTRMVPALNTWLRGQRATAFVDSSEANGQVDREVYVRHLQQMLAITPQTSLRIAFMDFQTCHSPFAFNFKRMSLNGAWKPLFVVVAFSMLVVDPHVRWLMLADDDTYIITANLEKHLRAFPLEQRTVYGCVFKYGTLFAEDSISLHPNRSSESTVIGESKKRFVSVEYAQGGGGILLSQSALTTLVDALRQLTLASAEVLDAKVATKGQCRESMDTIALHEYYSGNSSVKATYLLHLRRGFADEWPAGDMRVAWLLRRWNEHSSNKTLHVALKHHASFFHRTLGLTIGADRKHVRSAYPLSFHRLRLPSEIHDIHTIVEKASILSSAEGISWRVLEGILAEAWKQKLQKCESTSPRRKCIEAVREYFFDDEGHV